ncbi:MAG: hypothetical protein IIZ57_00755, partial [Solobacterium sp.]|nr:hypothetical protein [Solobacterium sp.]
SVPLSGTQKNIRNNLRNIAAKLKHGKCRIFIALSRVFYLIQLSKTGFYIITATAESNTLTACSTALKNAAFSGVLHV